MPTSVSLASGGAWYLGPLHPLSHGFASVEIGNSGVVLSSARLDLAKWHRGDIALLQARTLPQGLALANRPGWLCPAALEIAYAQATEEMLGLVVPARAVALRTIVLALQGVAGSLLRLAALGELAGQEVSKLLDSRERALSLLEELTGARIHDAFVRLGGVAEAGVEPLPDSLTAFAEQELPRVDFSAWSGQAITPSIAGVECLPHTETDAQSRAVAVWQEAEAARALLRDSVGSLPGGPVSSLLPKTIRFPEGRATAAVRYANGSTSVELIGDGSKAPAALLIQTDSQRLVGHFEQQAAGLSESTAKLLLATLPISPGEVAL